MTTLDRHSFRRTTGTRLPTLALLALVIATAMAPSQATAAFNLGNLGVNGLGGGGPGTKLNPFPNPAPQPTPFRPVEPLPAQPTGSLSMQKFGATYLTYIVYLQPGSFDLFRDGPEGSVHLETWTTNKPTSFSYTDSGLADGGSYCHRVVDRATRKSHQSCSRLPFDVVSFEKLAMTPSESDDVLARFDWERTDRLNATSIPPALYYGNVLVDHPHMADALRRAGMHVQEEPIFPEEAAAWTGSADLAMQDGEIVGRWHYVVVPGDIYNEVRDASIEALRDGETPQVRVLALRRIQDRKARSKSSDVYRLSYEHLGTLGFEFNADTSAGECETGIEGVGCQTQELLGWVIRHVGNFFAELADEVVDAVRRGFGEFRKLVFGKHRQSFEVRILNTDIDFGTNLEMMSGWAGKPIKLQHHSIQVRQGFGAIMTKTDGSGRAVANLAEGVPFQVCFDLENSYLEVTSLFVERTVCSPRFELTNDTVEVEIRHDHANVFMQITDAGRYLEEVLDYRVGKVMVQVGGISNTLTMFNGHRAFAPCGSKFPSVVSTLSEMIPVLSTIGVPADFMTAVDIVMPDASTKSRGVGVHEYGHTVLCDMIRKQAGHHGLATAWAQATKQSTTQKETDEAGYINEAFADFFTAQVVGGTNYFATPSSRQSGKVQYCNAAVAGVGDCLESNSGFSTDPFRNQVGRVAALLHDAFDGNPDCDPAGDFNDGAHWNTTTTPFRLHVPTHKDTCHVTSADEDIQLPDDKLPKVFDRWADLAGIIDTLGESEFLGALARVMVESGNASDDVCHLFAIHGTTCPIEIEPTVTGSRIDTLVLQPGASPNVHARAYTPIAEMIDEADDLPNTATLAFDGLETIRVAGTPRTTLESAFGVRLGEGSFEAVSVLGTTLSGTWKPRASGRGARVTLDPGAKIALRELIEVGVAESLGGAPGDVELVREPRVRISFRTGGAVTLRISTRFEATVDGETRRGRYSAALEGGAE